MDRCFRTEYRLLQNIVPLAYLIILSNYTQATPAGACKETPLTTSFHERQRPNAQGGYMDNKSNRGFASMDEDKQREIARKGGQSQGKENNPGNFANDPDKAREAGRKGGQNSHRGDDNE